MSSAPEAPPPLHLRRRARTTVAGACERVLDGSVVVLASWTVVYHLCLVLRLGVAVALALEVAVLAAAGVLLRPRRPPPDPAVEPATDLGGRTAAAGARPVVPTEHGDTASGGAGSAPTLEVVLLAAGVVSALAAAVVVALQEVWPLAATLWLGAAGSGVALAVIRARRLGGSPPGLARDHGASEPGRGVVVALTWAAGLAGLSMFARWPNPDDLYYVNLSQWIVENGTFPVRDTIFSDQVFPMSSWPPIASFDSLAGTVARVTGVHAASIVYLVVPPVATFLSVLALWRLQRQWRIPAIGVATSLAMLFLLFDGGTGYAAPGNLFLTRLYQGKVVLLCLMVPTLLVYALRYVERPTRARARWLLAGGVAAVGLSTTAMFVVPLLALAGAAPLVRLRPRRALVGFLSMAAYPLASGLVTLALGGRSADDFDSRRLFRFEPSWFGPEILRDGVVALIAVAAVLLAAFVLPHRAARLTAGLLAVAVGITFVPGVTQVGYDLVGLGPTLWRVSWILTIAALVGGLGALASRFLAERFDRRLGVAVPVLVALLLVGFGQPIWTADVGVTLDSTPQWKRAPSTVEVATQVIDAAAPGDVVLAPREVAITITVLTTEVKTVAPRAYFMDYLRDEPGFAYDERLTLIEFVDGAPDPPDAAEVVRALRVLDVDEVCLPVDVPARTALLLEQGYEPLTATDTFRCFAR